MRQFKKIKLVKIFYDFLVENYLLDEYLFELNKQINDPDCNGFFYDNSKCILENKCDSFNISKYIMFIFKWSGTDKGFDYWDNINYQWSEYLKSLGKNTNNDNDYILKAFKDESKNN